MDHFILNWHKFFIDYWWRKKYNISFGSKKHRDMNFIDMLIEYKEDLLITKQIKADVKIEDESDDEDYDNLDLEQFDND